MSPKFRTNWETEGQELDSWKWELPPLLLITLCWETWLSYGQRLAYHSFWLNRLVSQMPCLLGDGAGPAKPPLSRESRAEGMLSPGMQTSKIPRQEGRGWALPAQIFSSTHHSDPFPFSSQGIQGQKDQHCCPNRDFWHREAWIQGKGGSQPPPIHCVPGPLLSTLPSQSPTPQLSCEVLCINMEAKAS